MAEIGKRHPPAAANRGETRMFKTKKLRHRTAVPVLVSPATRWRGWLACNPNPNLRKNNSFMQNKPNLQNTQMNTTSFITKGYNNVRLHKPPKNKPNSNPIKANTNPIKPNYRALFGLYKSPSPAIMPCTPRPTDIPMVAALEDWSQCSA